MPSDTTDLLIGDIAHEVMELERSVPLDGGFDIMLGDTFTDAGIRAQFGKQEATASVRLYRMRDVTLDASLMLLLRGRSRIMETRYFVTDEEYAATLTKPLPVTPLDPREHYIIGCNRAWHNYYHWLIQSVPAIDLSLRYSVHRNPTLVLSSLRSWQEETLALLGIENFPKLTLDISGTYLFPNAEFSDFLSIRMPNMVSRRAMRVFARMTENVPWRRGASEEIYIAHSDAPNRVMTNEDDLMSMLEKRGVRVIVPGGLSVANQIAAFRAARLVIGPHGAGMSNIVFCEPGAFIYEMLPRHYPNPAFNRLAQAAELNYWADMYDGAEQDGSWRVDLDLVAARLDAIRERRATGPKVESAMNFLRRTQAVHPYDTDAPPSASVPEPEVQASEPRRRRLFGGLFSRRGR